MRGTPVNRPRRAGTGIGRMWRPSRRRGSSPTKHSPRPPGRRTPIRVWRRSSWPPTRRSPTRPPRTAQGGVAPVEVGSPVDDFTVDELAGAVGCPAGHTRPISRTRVASFGALCRECPLRERCTTSKTGRKIVLHHRDDLLRQARGDWAATPELREKYRKFRPNVERVVSQIASRGGRRLKLRYHGTEKNHAWLTRRADGLNLRYLLGRGLTHTAGSWVLAAQTA